MLKARTVSCPDTANGHDGLLDNGKTASVSAAPDISGLPAANLRLIGL